MDQNQEESGKQPVLTPEQMAQFEEFKRQRQLHFEKEIPQLKVQKEYEQLLTEIDELYLRRLIVEVRVAQIKTPPEPEKDQILEGVTKEADPGNQTEVPQSRTLKKD